MASKKTTVKKSEAKPEAKAKAAMPAAPMTAEKSPASKAVWTLPVALLMLVVASGALWMAVRESSNTSQAATPAATSVMTPDGAAKTAAKPAAASSASMASPTSGDSAKASETSAVASKPVSITGCLKRDSDGFVLKNTEGTDAPKSRSWKSGFFKRSSATVTLNDTGTAHLADHVGQRVSVTGPLTDREMRVTSLRRLAATCE